MGTTPAAGEASSCTSGEAANNNKGGHCFSSSLIQLLFTLGFFRTQFEKECFQKAHPQGPPPIKVGLRADREVSQKRAKAIFKKSAKKHYKKLAKNKAGMNNGDMAIMTCLSKILSEYWLSPEEVAEAEEETRRMQAARGQNWASREFDKAVERGPMSHVDGRIPKKLYRDAGSQVHHPMLGKLKLFNHPGHPQLKTIGTEIIRDKDEMGNYFPEILTPDWHSLPYLGYAPRKGPKCFQTPKSNTQEVQLAPTEEPALPETAISNQTTKGKFQKDEPPVTDDNSTPPATPLPDLTLSEEMKARGATLFGKTNLSTKISPSSFTFHSQTVVISDDEEEEIVVGKITYPDPIVISSDEEDSSDSEDCSWEIPKIHTLQKSEGIIDEDVQKISPVDVCTVNPTQHTDSVKMYKALVNNPEIVKDLVPQSQKLSKSAKRKLSKKLRKAHHYVQSVQMSDSQPTATTSNSDHPSTSTSQQSFLQELQDILEAPAAAPASQPASPAPSTSSSTDDELSGDPLADLFQFADQQLDLNNTQAYEQSAIFLAKGSF